MKATAEILLTGRLAINAHTAQVPHRDGHFVPALCFELEPTNGGKRFKVERHYPEGDDKACEEDAKHMRKGAEVRFSARTENILYKAVDVSNLEVVTPAPVPTAAPAAAEPAPAVPDMFAVAGQA